MPDLLLPFLALVTLLTITPGPDLVLVLRNGVRGGPRIAWATGFGCCTGIAIHAVAAVVGLSALIAASAEAFAILKIAGAVYLIWLGLSSIASSIQPPNGNGPEQRTQPQSRAEAFRQGLISNLLNPKIAILFLTLLPQFIAPGEPRIATTVVLAAGFLLVGLVWMRLISLAIRPIAGILARDRVAQSVERVTGAVLITLGIRVGLDRG